MARFIISCGGNDALALVPAMQSRVGSVLEAMELMAQWQHGFRADYLRMLDLAHGTGIPFAVATIYDAVPGLGAGLRTALAVFNDVIVSAAAARGLPLLDLRLVCADAADYSAMSPIEPSEQGARKIAAALATMLSDDGSAGGTRIVGPGTAVP